MKIKKLGHCCMVIEINGKRVMTDPGLYTVSEQREILDVDFVVITHEHPDHFHIDSLKDIIKNNPDVIIITNTSVGKLLLEQNISFKLLEDGNSTEFESVFFEAHGSKHEEIYEEIGQVQNTGYFIGKDLFYPGDAFTNPNKKIDILALPVAGPWTNIKTPIKYALQLKPRICFPVHDGMLAPNFGTAHRAPSLVLPQNGIEFKVLEIGKEEEI